jgi:Protein of unknown function (DUF2946)
MLRRSQRGWWRIVAGILIYALVLQGFLFAAGIGSAATAAAGDAQWPGFELCSHGGAAPSPTSPAAPVGDNHCPFCVVGAVYVDGAPPSAPQYSVMVFTNAVWPLTAPRLVAPVVDASAWPRGPPCAA